MISDSYKLIYRANRRYLNHGTFGKSVLDMGAVNSCKLRNKSKNKQIVDKISIVNKNAQLCL
jgi:hypothetical protein